MIMLDGAHYPVYPGLPYGLYSHVEPVVGILSDHPLTDENFYDDDVVLHYTDVPGNQCIVSRCLLAGLAKEAIEVKHGETLVLFMFLRNVLRETRWENGCSGL